VENADEEIDTALRPNIRIMTVKRADNLIPQISLSMYQNWTSATPGNVNDFNYQYRYKHCRLCNKS